MQVTAADRLRHLLHVIVSKALFDATGWYEYKTGGHGAAPTSAAQQTKADEVQKRAELQWLKARLDARLKRMEGAAGLDSGALVVNV